MFFASVVVPAFFEFDLAEVNRVIFGLILTVSSLAVSLVFARGK